MEGTVRLEFGLVRSLRIKHEAAPSPTRGDAAKTSERLDLSQQSPNDLNAI